MADAKGALTGAAAGAAIGSAVPVIGTGIGAIAGGIIGSGVFGDIGNWISGGGDSKPSSYQDRDQIMGLINKGYAPGGITQQTSPQAQAAQLQMGNDPFRRAQLRQVGQLQQIASGQQQGAGELAAQRQTANAQAAQQALARMARGSNAGLAYRGAANQTASAGLNGVGMGQQAALQDQQAAQEMLANAVNAGRGADINVAGQNAGFQQQAGLSNAAMQGQTQQQNAQNYLALLSQLSGMDATQLTGQNASNMANSQMNNALLGAGISAGGQILASNLGRSTQPAATAAPATYTSDSGGMPDVGQYSDKRVKKNIRVADSANDDMLDKLVPSSWDYKDDRMGKGRRTGVMAQDLEKSKVGDKIVYDVPEIPGFGPKAKPLPAAKAIDLGAAVSALLASSARLHHRLKAVE